MKTFNFNKPYEELSFHEILSVLLEIADSIEIEKLNVENKLIYHITTYRNINNYDSDDELELDSLSIKWCISSKDINLDTLDNQSSYTYSDLDSYFESAINLGLIELKFIEC